MHFEIILALRHLVHNGRQTVLTIFAVAIASMVVLFVQVTISGMQTRIVRDLVDSTSHLTIKPADTLPQPLEQTEPTSPGTLTVSYQQPRLQQRTDIEQWKPLVDQISRYPGVRIAVATVVGNAFILRGSKRNAIEVTGTDPEQFDQIGSIQKNLLVGRWLDISPDEMVIGVKLANDLRLRVRDRVVVKSSTGVAQSFRIAGIFYKGNAADVTQVYVTRRAAQSLLGTGQNISNVQAKLTDAFQANDIAIRLSEILPYKVDSWMTDQANILNVIKSQGAIQAFLTTFVLLASSVAVSAIMIVSVLQKNKQIGILKSMGARNGQIMIVFTLEGLGIAIAGAGSGVLLAIVAMNTMAKFTMQSPFGKADAVFTIIYNPVSMGELVLTVIAATVAAATFPAYQAAKLNPVEAIRG